MDIKEQLKDIKTQLRLSMNGAVSKSMREKGLLYKLNFGVELPLIKMIAEGYEKNHDLAQALWKENIRECKIMDVPILRQNHRVRKPVVHLLQYHYQHRFQE